MAPQNPKSRYRWRPPQQDCSQRGAHRVFVTNTGAGWLTAPVAISTPPQTRAPTTPEITPTSQVRPSGPTNQPPTERFGRRGGTDGLERTSEGCLQSRSSGGSHGLLGLSSSSSPGPCGGCCSGSILHTRLLTCSAALTSAPRDLRPFDFGGPTGLRLTGVATCPQETTGSRCLPSPSSLGQFATWAVVPSCGAVVVFAGTVREHAEGRPGVISLEYEAYEGVALDQDGIDRPGATQAMAVCR